MLLESPYFCPETGLLSFVDIDASILFTGHLLRNSTFSLKAQLNFEDGLTSCKPLQNGDFVVTTRSRLGIVSNGNVQLSRKLVSVDSRFNDSFLTNGGLYAGTMARFPQPNLSGQNYLFYYTREGTTERLLDDVGLSNGICFSPDGEIVHVDSYRKTISIISETGRRSELYNHQGSGEPDGLVGLGKDGYLVAIWGEGEVRHLTPNGTIVRAFKMPFPFVTSIALLGTDKGSAIATGYREGLEPSEANIELGLHVFDLGFSISLTESPTVELPLNQF